MIELKWTKKLTDRDAISVFEILCGVDSEFIPHLSYRDSSVYKFNSELKKEIMPVSYFEEVKLQGFILAFEQNELIGFLTYKEDFENRIKSDLILKGEYITTIAIRKKSRGKGIASKLYTKMLEISNNKTIYTRTWSTNNNHIRILNKMGFYISYSIKDERGLGVDTVYFNKNN